MQKSGRAESWKVIHTATEVTRNHDTGKAEESVDHTGRASGAGDRCSENRSGGYSLMTQASNQCVLRVEEDWSRRRNEKATEEGYQFRRAPRERTVHREGTCQGLTMSISELEVGEDRCIQQAIQKGETEK